LRPPHGGLPPLHRACLPKSPLVQAPPPKTALVRAKLASLIGVTRSALRILPGRRPVTTYAGVQGSSRTPSGARTNALFGNRAHMDGFFGSRLAGAVRAGRPSAVNCLLVPSPLASLPADRTRPTLRTRKSFSGLGRAKPLSARLLPNS
jgi:hypothetical protein